MFSPSFIRMQNQSSLMTRMLGTSSLAVGKKTGGSFLQKKSVGMSASDQLALMRNKYDTFSRKAISEMKPPMDEWTTKQLRTQATSAELSGRPKATLEDVSTAFSEARTANREKLNAAGNQIIAVNERAGEGLGRAGTLINGKQYDFASSEYVSGGAYTGEYDRNLFNRQMVNRQIGNILSENGISISEGEDYTFTVDAYTKRISASGADSDKSRAIEDALNTGGNGKNLYDHIRMCGTLEKNEQISQAGQALRYTNELVTQFVGVNLADCTQRGNDYITSDGQSIRTMLTDYVMQHPTEGFKQQDEVKLTLSYLDWASQYSYQDAEAKMDLSIRFNSTGLHDVGQKNGYGDGDTDWISERIAADENATGKKVMTLFI